MGRVPLVLYGGSETTITDPTFSFSFLPFFLVLISMAHFDQRLAAMPTDTGPPPPSPIIYWLGDATYCSSTSGFKF